MVSFVRSLCLLRVLLAFCLVDMVLYGILLIVSASVFIFAAFHINHVDLSRGIVGSNKIQNLFLTAFTGVFCLFHVILAVYLRLALTKNNHNSCLKWMALFPITFLLGHVLLPLLPYFRDGLLHSYIVYLDISLLFYNIIEYLVAVSYIRKFCQCNKDIPRVEGLYGELF